MASKRSPFDDKLARIAALTAEAPATATAELRKLLGDRSGYLAGAAAEAAAKLELRALSPDIAAALTRLFGEPASADRGCLGKKRLLEALLQLDAYEPDVYLAGLRYTQLEGAFGGPTDTAGAIRSLCAHALFQIDHAAAAQEVTPLLVDPLPDVRAEAAAALGNSGLPACAAVLHLKVLTGDSEPDVLGACFRALLRLDAPRYLPLVAAELRDNARDSAEAAAVALGESRAAGAFDTLKDALAAGAAGRVRDAVMLGLALLRSDEANDLLISLVEKAPEAQAAAALGALALHRHDERIADRARKAVEARRSRKLSEALKERFNR